MSRWADLKYSFEYQFAELRRYPEHSIGWLLAAERFNTSIDEMCENGLEWNDFDLKFPEGIIHDPLDGDYSYSHKPKIHFGNYDMNHVPPQTNDRKYILGRRIEPYSIDLTEYQMKYLRRKIRSMKKGKLKLSALAGVKDQFDPDGHFIHAVLLSGIEQLLKYKLGMELE
jgi:hypothetical protein